MILSVNLNNVWCELFVHCLSELGVKYACISPGSRSTPLTLALASNKSITTFSIVDERSSAFYALGLAKQSKTPVVIVTTSGTAVAEIYPAIIEAFYQRIPLIICTADRPPLLRGKGANQTINQHNIYVNHIRFFKDAGLPEIKRLNDLKNLTEEAVKISWLEDKGPVHINFPFEKPFEPDSHTHKISAASLKKLFAKLPAIQYSQHDIPVSFKQLSKKIRTKKRGLIIVGFNNYEKDFAENVIRFSEKFGYPIYADGTSPLRFGLHSRENIIENFGAIIRSKNYYEKLDPEIIIHFGGAPTANVLNDFYKQSKAEKIMVNEFGDWNDPSLTAKQVVKCNPSTFCRLSVENVEELSSSSSGWLNTYQNLNALATSLKGVWIENAGFPFEGRIIKELIKSLPNRCNLMLSNSLPVRDFDFFAASNDKQINIFSNRGASGIDGINSTALGIARASKLPTFLLIGDLAFYHDMNGLHNALKYKTPLTIILINNSGGGIFESLPISNHPEVLKDHFLTPLQIEFKMFVNAFKGNYISITSWKELEKELISSSKSTRLTVLEIKTDAKKSKLQRQKYWSKVATQIEKYIDEIVR